MPGAPASSSSSAPETPKTAFPPPIVTYVCQPEPLGFNRLAIAAQGGGVLIVGVVAVITGVSWPGALLGVSGFAVIAGAIFGAARLARSHFHRLERARFLKRHPNWDADPLAAALAKEWRTLPRVPSAGTVRAAVPRASACRIICFGVPELPQFEPMVGEPIVVTPFERFGVTFVPMATMGTMVVFLYALESLGIIRLPGPRLGLFGGAMGAGAFALSMWIWHVGLWPCYVRVAPRKIQFLHYKSYSQKPTIRSYPADPTTFVCIQQSGHLTFVSPEYSDRWGGNTGANHPTRLVLMLAAMNAQRATPPLSDTELAG